jgi:hypothetical protein
MLTQEQHPGSYLAFACDVASFIADYEMENPDAPPRPGQVELTDSNIRFARLRQHFAEIEKSRLERYDVTASPAYLDDLANSKAMTHLVLTGPRKRSERDLFVDVVVGTHCAVWKNQVKTCQVLNRGIPTAGEAYGLQRWQVRNALETFARPWISMISRLGPETVGRIYFDLAEISTAEAFATLKLWQQLGGARAAPKALDELFLSEEIVPRFRAAFDEVAQFPERYGASLSDVARAITKPLKVRQASLEAERDRRAFIAPPQG